MFDPAEFARTAVTTYITTGQWLRVPEGTPAEWMRPAGAFVCIKIGGRLRGCVGTYLPREASLVKEIMRNAVGSATGDPRFQPITADELDTLAFTVDVLEPPEKVTDLGELDPEIYGVIVRAGARTGLLLPDLEGVETVGQQITIAKQKAGIAPEEPAEIFKFRVTRYE